MSEHSISIVPRQSSYPDNRSKAYEILDWLVSKDIVKKTSSDCILSSEYGYAISDGARLVSPSPDYLPFDYNINGLEIVIERCIFDAGEGGLDKIICPNCLKNIANEDWDLNPWYNKESDNLICPACRHETDIHKFRFEPTWGFSDLGFTFWNWPDFTDEFISDFKKKLECDISIVHTHR
ncbi:MAG: sugar ABC transporter ATPase [Bacteroidota bacterium]